MRKIVFTLHSLNTFLDFLSTSLAMHVYFQHHYYHFRLHKNNNKSHTINNPRIQDLNFLMNNGQKQRSSVNNQTNLLFLLFRFSNFCFFRLFRLICRWFGYRREKLHLPVALSLDPFYNFKWICFFPLHHNLMALAICLNIFHS